MFFVFITVVLIVIYLYSVNYIVRSNIDYTVLVGNNNVKVYNSNIPSNISNSFGHNVYVGKSRYITNHFGDKTILYNELSSYEKTKMYFYTANNNNITSIDDIHKDIDVYESLLRFLVELGKFNLSIKKLTKYNYNNTTKCLVFTRDDVENNIISISNKEHLLGNIYILLTCRECDTSTLPIPLLKYLTYLDSKIKKYSIRDFIEIVEREEFKVVDEYKKNIVLSSLLDKWLSCRYIIVNIDNTIGHKIKYINGPLNIVHCVLRNDNYNIDKEFYMFSDIHINQHRYYDNIPNIVSIPEIFDIILKINKSVKIDFYIEHFLNSVVNMKYSRTCPLKVAIDFFNSNKDNYSNLNYVPVDIRYSPNEGEWMCNEDNVIIEINNLSKDDKNNLVDYLFSSISNLNVLEINKISINPNLKRRILDYYNIRLNYIYTNYRTRDLKWLCSIIFVQLMDYYTLLKIFSSDTKYNLYFGGGEHTYNLVSLFNIICDNSKSKFTVYGNNNYEKFLEISNLSNDNSLYDRISVNYNIVDVTNSTLPYFESNKEVDLSSMNNDYDKLDLYYNNNTS